MKMLRFRNPHSPSCRKRNFTGDTQWMGPRGLWPPRGRPQNQSPPTASRWRNRAQTSVLVAAGTRGQGRRGPAGIILRVQRYHAGNQCVGSPVTKGKVNNPSSVLGWKASDPTVSLPENEKGNGTVISGGCNTITFQASGAAALFQTAISGPGSHSRMAGGPDEAALWSAGDILPFPRGQGESHCHEDIPSPNTLALD